tara:strand:- start:24181 stop:24384 length:204 start_codon:yes stop_codon:yes gene_type:complete
MLRDARMADLVELRRGIGTVGGRQLWAERNGRGCPPCVGLAALPQARSEPTVVALAAPAVSASFPRR